MAFFAWRRGAQVPPQEGSATEIRAGERKTDWTKPLAPSPGLWALNAAGSLAGALSGHSEWPPGAIRRRERCFERSAQAGFERLSPVQALLRSSQSERHRPDLADCSASCGCVVVFGIGS